jgi:hypothetical protein
MTVSIPYKDTNSKDYTICSKETTLKAFSNKIGSYIDFGGVRKKVINVTVVDEQIHIELE